MITVKQDNSGDYDLLFFPSFHFAFPPLSLCQYFRTEGWENVIFKSSLIYKKGKKCRMSRRRRKKHCNNIIRRSDPLKQMFWAMMEKVFILTSQRRRMTGKSDGEKSSSCFFFFVLRVFRSNLSSLAELHIFWHSKSFLR